MRSRPGVFRPNEVLLCRPDEISRPDDIHVWMRYHVATSISSGQNIMMELHNVARPDEILHRDGISLVCNMSAQWSSDKYRSRLDCLH